MRQRLPAGPLVFQTMVITLRARESMPARPLVLHPWFAWVGFPSREANLPRSRVASLLLRFATVLSLPSPARLKDSLYLPPFGFLRLFFCWDTFFWQLHRLQRAYRMYHS